MPLINQMFNQLNRAMLRVVGMLLKGIKLKEIIGKRKVLVLKGDKQL